MIELLNVKEQETIASFNTLQKDTVCFLLRFLKLAKEKEIFVFKIEIWKDHIEVAVWQPIHRGLCFTVILGTSEAEFSLTGDFCFFSKYKDGLTNAYIEALFKGEYFFQQTVFRRTKIKRELIWKNPSLTPMSKYSMAFIFFFFQKNFFTKSIIAQGVCSI